MPAAMQPLDHDVVIVGAGAAGLAAARALERDGRDVLVVEARDRVGGRMVNHEFAGGHVVEIGGQWLGPTQDHALDLTRELGLDLFETYTSGASIGIPAPGQRVRFGLNELPLPKRVLTELLVLQRRLERMARSVPLDEPWSAPKADRWDGTTVAAWLRTNARQQRSREFLRLLTAGIFAAEPEELSLLHFLFYVHSGGGLDRLADVTGGAQEQRVVGGTQLIAVRAAEQLRRPPVLSSPVRAIAQEADAVTVHTTSRAVRAGAAIVAIPPHLGTGIDFSPALPGRRAQLVQKMPMGSVIKCVALYERPFWRDAGLNGAAFSFSNPVSLTFDNSPHDGGVGMLLGFLEGRHAREASALAPADRRTLVLDAFVEYFGAGAAQPLDYVDKDWSAEEWTGGCYGAHFVPGAWTQLGPELRRPHGRVHWAGTETATVWNGYIDGAISSGLRAAREVAAHLG